MRRIAAALVAGLLGIAPLGARAAVADLAQYVNPFVGTAGGGFAFPGAAAPYGMVQISPDTEGIFAYTGYQYTDQFIRGFSMVHVESMGVQEGGALPFMPTTGAVVTDVRSYESKFDHATESAAPGVYRARLDTYGIDAVVAAGTRAGIQRYTFPATTQANVIIDAGRQIAGGSTQSFETTPGTTLASVDVVDDHTVVGTSKPASDDRDYYTVHFAARFDRAFTGSGMWDERGAAAQPGVSHIADRKGGGAYVTFDTTTNPTVTMKVGISFVSAANALANLDAELPGADFDADALAARTRAAWNDALHAIEVEGGTPADLTSFYTALYHAQHHPNVFNDANGEYLGYDGAVHTIGADGVMPAGSTYYANFSLWDTYRAEMPLLEMIAPDRARDMMRSLAAISVQGGRLPKWGLMNKYADYMIGEPALQVVADAWCRGLVPPDVKDELYAAMRALTVGNPYHDGPRFDQYGFVPNDKSNVGASTTMETASGEFAFALVAEATGHDADATASKARAQAWQAVFDPETRFVRPRLSNGSFVANYHPEMPDGFKEGTGWQWTWLVPHDVAGLAARFDAGAPPADDTRARLDTFFSTVPSAAVPLAVAEAQQKITAFGIAYYGNQYAPSNEHDLQAPYLYNWLGAPWKTQAIAREDQGLFRPTPDGLPGNDDLGTMSAWFVWSALGFYPEIPGAPLQLIGSPLFERAAIRVPGGSFTVEAPGANAASKYVQSATLDGAPLDATYFPTARIASGHAVRFEMGPAPSTTWGSAPEAAPPSQSTSAGSLAAYGCAP